MEALNRREKILYESNQYQDTQRCFQKIKLRLADLLEEMEDSFQELSKMAYLDPLTNLPRREVLEKAVNENLDHGGNGTLILLDVDHFKAVNDTFGHPIGDEVLKGIAQVLQRVGKDCQLGRLGGEEFAVWYPGASKSKAHAIAERIRVAVESSCFAGVPVTVSVGISSQGSGWTDFYNDADKALYEAKNSGRNQVKAA